MAAAGQQGVRGEWTTFLSVLLIVGLLAAWALVPVQVMEQSLQAERNQMAAWGGEAADRWIMSRAAGWMDGVVQEAVEQTEKLGGSAMERWLAGRIYASVLWAALVAYRVSSLAVWGLLGLPLILAASVDGFYVREIRKHAFTAQSPIRHKIGVHFMSWSGLLLLVWLIVPVPMPLIVAPAVICLMALSVWMWLANLQKRI
ncbi:DUF4400 domain-containing protein [Pelomicrobium methylotrophicum]|uniref:DUF4400 domain-containing protein n=1 Tax=Pelomicrobium methylotrophicum TaxID=2602750 RepID=A0A5C7EIH8_9PROT|nr:DUF4400 domain-containing protein [Pelomicrobium methylotrophicum]TXF11190.1 DUF4400 domain-containing protein [Pelomicrobium methylotrophicum]